jgi:hypothetical protein
MDNGPSFHAEKKRCAEMATFYNFLTLRSTTLDKFIDLCELLGCSFVAERDLQGVPHPPIYIKPKKFTCRPKSPRVQARYFYFG